MFCYNTADRCLLFTDSRSHILSAPDKEPAITVSSELLNLTASTGLVWPDKLCRVTNKCIQLCTASMFVFKVICTDYSCPRQ